MQTTDGANSEAVRNRTAGGQYRASLSSSRPGGDILAYARDRRSGIRLTALQDPEDLHPLIRNDFADL